MFIYLFIYLFIFQGRAQTRSPTTTKHAAEFPTLGGIPGISTSGVQWMSLTWGNPSVSMASPLRGKQVKCTLTMTEFSGT